MRRSPKNGGGEAEVKIMAFDPVTKKKKQKTVKVDSRWIVPYNRKFILEYDCHSNVEIVQSVSVFKYLFKYIFKGVDKASYNIVPENSENNGNNKSSGNNADKEKNKDGDKDKTGKNKKDINEIAEWRGGRYVGSIEACWRALGFRMCKIYPSTQRLDFHLPNEQMLIFEASADKNEVLSKSNKTMLTEWFTLNKTDEYAKHFTYKDLVMFYTWRRQTRKWVRRAQGLRDKENFDLFRDDKIGFLPSIVPRGENGVEKFAQYVLILHASGPTSFKDLRTINGKVYPTNKEAALAAGLMEGEKEIHETLQESFMTQTGKDMRIFFAMVMANCVIEKPLAIWEQYKDRLCEDFVRFELRKDNPRINMSEMYKKALQSISFFLEDMGSSLKKAGLPQIKEEIVTKRVESIFFKGKTSAESNENTYKTLNEDQANIYNTVVESVMENSGNFFFIDAPGGTGKTYLLNAIIEKLTHQNKNVCPTASSGVAAILLKGGGTLHSKMKIPFVISDEMDCNIKRQSKLCSEINKMDLLIWDEAPMFQKEILECLNRSLQDLRRNKKLFGGVTVLLSGDWRQILPIVNGGRAATVQASHKCSDLWDDVRVLTLKKNMRIKSDDNEAKQFKEFLLNLGDGKLNNADCYGTNEVLCLPDKYVLKGDTVRALVDKIYPDIDVNCGNEDYVEWITNRAIVASTNKEVNAINKMCLSRLPGHEYSLLSIDQPEKVDRNSNVVSIDFLNSMEEGGMPPHDLRLKIGAPVTLLRNLVPSQGHCNGTRYIVKKINPRTLELEVASGQHKGEIFLLPKIKLFDNGKKSKINFSRKQFPVNLSFAFTANKAQGQSINIVGVCALNDFFTHGQFYVAISRATDPKNVCFTPPQFKLDNH